MTNYSIGDFLIRIKNASFSGKKEVEVFSNKFIKATAKALKEAGFLESFEEKKGKLIVQISYKNKKPVLMDLKIISRPGLRIYMGVDEIEKVKRPSIFIISTPKGVISSIKAKKERIGGEIIAEVW